MSGDLNRARASELMERAGLEALVLCEPEAVQYVTDAPIPAAGLFRRAGACFALVPRRTDLPLGLVVPDYEAPLFAQRAPDAVLVSHPSWIECVRLDAETASQPLEQRVEESFRSLQRWSCFTRPETFDFHTSAHALSAIMADIGIRTGRVGLDLGFVPAADLPVLVNHLKNYELVDATAVLDRLRAIKSDREIELLQLGIAFSESGMGHMLSNAAVGMTPADLVSLYRAGVANGSQSRDCAVSTKEYLFVGDRERCRSIPARAGDPVKADMICEVDGYGADMSRNFVFGSATSDQMRLHAIVEQAFERGVAELVPGNLLGNVYRAVSEELARQGIPSYQRGHFGHGVGNSVFSEQWPFISAGSQVKIEPCMVLAFEVPLYVDGVARFNLEDQFLVTPTGTIPMNRMPRGLAVV